MEPGEAWFCNAAGATIEALAAVGTVIIDHLAAAVGAGVFRGTSWPIDATRFVPGRVGAELEIRAIVRLGWR